jgi:hypothetical protein
MLDDLALIEWLNERLSKRGSTDSLSTLLSADYIAQMSRLWPQIPSKYASMKPRIILSLLTLQSPIPPETLLESQKLISLALRDTSLDSTWSRVCAFLVCKLSPALMNDSDDVLIDAGDIMRKSVDAIVGDVESSMSSAKYAQLSVSLQQMPYQIRMLPLSPFVHGMLFSSSSIDRFHFQKASSQSLPQSHPRDSALSSISVHEAKLKDYSSTLVELNDTLLIKRVHVGKRKQLEQEKAELMESEEARTESDELRLKEIETELQSVESLIQGISIETSNRVEKLDQNGFSSLLNYVSGSIDRFTSTSSEIGTGSERVNVLHSTSRVGGAGLAGSPASKPVVSMKRPRDRAPEIVELNMPLRKSFKGTTPAPGQTPSGVRGPSHAPIVVPAPAVLAASTSGVQSEGGVAGGTTAGVPQAPSTSTSTSTSDENLVEIDRQKLLNVLTAGYKYLPTFASAVIQRFADGHRHLLDGFEEAKAIIQSHAMESANVIKVDSTKIVFLLEDMEYNEKKGSKALQLDYESKKWRVTWTKQIVGS